MSPSTHGQGPHAHARGPLLSDIAHTTGAFAAIVGVQQIVLLPYIASQAAPGEFARVILIITISAVIANLVGGESGNTLLIRGQTYSNSAIRWDFHRIFIASSLIGLALSVAIWAWIEDGLQTVILAAALTALTSLRLFLAAPLRLQQRFPIVTVAHASYVLASTFFLIPAVRSSYFVLPFLAGEVTAILVLVIAIWRSGPETILLLDGAPQSIFRSARIYLALATAGMFANMVGYLDRLLIAPILGSTALAVYFAASVIPKSISTLVNPAAGLLLAKIGSRPDTEAPRILERLGRILPFVTAIGTAIAFIAGYLGLSILYPQYSEAGQSVLLPASLSVGIGSSAYLLQSFAMRFRKPTFVVYANAVQATVFAVAALNLSPRFGIAGFAWSSVLGSIVHLAAMLILSFGMPFAGTSRDGIAQPRDG